MPPPGIPSCSPAPPGPPDFLEAITSLSADHDCHLCSRLDGLGFDPEWLDNSLVRSVANLTREDGWKFLEIAPKIPVKTEVETFPLEEANEALDCLRGGKIQGVAVLTMDYLESS